MWKSKTNFSTTIENILIQNDEMDEWKWFFFNKNFYSCVILTECIYFNSVDANMDMYDIPYDVIWLDIEHTDGKR